MQTTTTTIKRKAITPINDAKKTETFRSYLYTNKTNKNWIVKNAKAFGSEAKFLDALVTAARKAKMEVAVPKIKKTITKKAGKAVRKTIKKGISKNTKTINKLKA